MSKRILDRKDLSPVKMFREMNPGDEVLIPNDDGIVAGIKAEAARQNKTYRDYNHLSLASIKFRVSTLANPGFITVIRVV